MKRERRAFIRAVIAGLLLCGCSSGNSYTEYNSAQGDPLQGRHS